VSHTIAQMPLCARLTADCPEPGIYPNVPDGEYRSWRAVSASMLKQLVNADGTPKPPAYLRAWLDGKRNFKSKATAFGTNYHAFVLQPERFEAEYVVAPRVRRDVRSEAYAALLERAGGDESRIVFEDELIEMRQAVESLRAESRQRKLVAHPGDAEVAVVWDDEDTGMRCKARIDKLLPSPHDFALDLKTTADCNIREFSSDIAHYGYDLQAAHYTDGLRERGRECRYLIVAQEKEYPYLSRLFDLTDPRVSPCAVEVGRDKSKLAMRVLAGCIESGEWPGYGAEVTPVAMASWSIVKEGLDNE
jgi:hypothetical protein